MPLVRLSENGMLRLILPVSGIRSAPSSCRAASTGPGADSKSYVPGRVARFADRVQVGTRTMDTEVDVPNADLVFSSRHVRRSRPSRSTIAQRRSPYRSPRSIPILIRRTVPKTGKILTVTADNHVEERNVALGMETANHVEVLSGLGPGDLVVIRGREPAARSTGQAEVRHYVSRKRRSVSSLMSRFAIKTPYFICISV